MRSVLFLGSMLVMASASGTCEIDSGDAVSSALDSVLNIWAATKRCNGPILTQAPVKCEQDVASAIESVSRMATAIEGMVGDCNGGLTQEGKCGVSVTTLIGTSAGLAAASGKIADKCFKTVPAQYDGKILQEATLLGKCVANSGAGMNSFFKASNGIQDATKNCGQEGKKCTTSRLNVVSILAHMGGFIAESVDECSAAHDMATATKGMDTSAVECAGAIMDGIGDLSTFANLAMNMQKDCDLSSSRLYLESEGTDAKAATGTPTLLALAAMVSISAVLSFVAGSRFGKSRRVTRTIPCAQELE
jgi:hypothetical protein